VKTQTLKKTLNILVILLIIVIGLGGIYVQEKGNWTSLLPEYQFATDLKGYRSIVLKVSEETKEVEDTTNTTEDNTATENTTTENTTTENTAAENTTTNTTENKKTEPVNSEDKLTVDNYVASKKIVEKRLQQISPDNYYTIKQDSYNGNIFIQMVDTEDAEELASVFAQQGKFRMIDNETKEELMTNADIKNAKVGYSAQETGYVVYLNLEFTKEGAEKLKQISNTYVKTTEPDGESTKEVTKKIDMNIDDETILSTYFSQEIENGIIQLTIGEATTSYEKLQEYLSNASRMAVILDNGEMPLAYVSDENAYNGTYLTTEHVKIIFIVAGIVLAILVLVMIGILKKKALEGILSFVGYIAAYLLVLRFANVYISLETMAGMVVATILGYLAILKFFTMPQTESSMQKQFMETIKQVVVYMLPISIIAITLCFAKWLPLYNFGMAVFWGVVITLVWNAIFTRTSMVNTTKTDKAREEGK